MQRFGKRCQNKNFFIKFFKAETETVGNQKI